MALKQDFDAAAQNVQKLARRPGNDDLLALYGLYKQATEGDAKGAKPGLFDLKGRKKFEAWESRRGMSQDAAMTAYVALVQQLQQSHR